MFCSNSFAAKVKLQCKGLLERLEGDSIYLTFDEKTIEVMGSALKEITRD